jgi:hypothetical protein
MKGVPGLLIAIALGIVGAICNMLYLAQKGQELERVDFIGIDDGQKINPGDKFQETQFRKISIPRNALGNLEKSACQWSELQTVVGMAATKSYSPGEIVLRQHLRTPPETDVKRLLAPDERVLWIPVDTRTFVASLVNAGDQVSFIVPQFVRTGPVPVDSNDRSTETRSGSAETRMIGPFRILALGNRLGSQEVLRAAGMTPSQENVMAVAVKVVGKELDATGQELSDLLRKTNFQQVQVLLHPVEDAARKLNK